MHRLLELEGNLEPTTSGPMTPAKMYEVLQTGIKDTDEISFKLLGLVPLVNGAALLTAVLGIGSKLPPAVFALSLFGAAVTLGLFWWELRNIRYCLWYAKLAETFEVPLLERIGVPERLRTRPSAPGGVGKRKAEKLIYSTVIISWLTLPFALLGATATSWIAWLAYAVAAFVVIVFTAWAVSVDVELPRNDQHSSSTEHVSAPAGRPRALADEAVVSLNPSRDYLAPDGSEIRLLIPGEHGGLAHCVLPAGKISAPVRHRTVEELWYVLEGAGEIARHRVGEPARVDPLRAGDSLRIPVDTEFQFRAARGGDLTLLIATMPPWPGASEAVAVERTLLS